MLSFIASVYWLRLCVHLLCLFIGCGCAFIYFVHLLVVAVRVCTGGTQGRQPEAAGARPLEGACARAPVRSVLPPPPLPLHLLPPGVPHHDAGRTRSCQQSQSKCCLRGRSRGPAHTAEAFPPAGAANPARMCICLCPLMRTCEVCSYGAHEDRARQAVSLPLRPQATCTSTCATASSRPPAPQGEPAPVPQTPQRRPPHRLPPRPSRKPPQPSPRPPQRVPTP